MDCYFEKVTYSLNVKLTYYYPKSPSSCEMTWSGFPQAFTTQLSESPNGIISLRELMINVNEAMDA